MYFPYKYTWSILEIHFKHTSGIFVYQDIELLSFRGMKSWFYQLRGFSVQTSFYKLANLHQFIKPHVLLNTQLLVDAHSICQICLLLFNWLQNKLLHLFIKEICQTFIHKNWNKMPQKKRLEFLYF